MNRTNKQDFKRRLFSEFARIGKALASPHRLHIIEILAQGERSVEELAGELDLPIANASQHLQILRGAQMVEVRRDGLYAHYRLADEGVFRVWQALRDLGEARLAEIERVVAEYLRDRKDLEPVGAAELRKRLRDDTGLIVLDVRPRPEYEAGHIPGARSIPVDELLKRLREVPRDRDIVAYCRGPYCVFSDEAVQVLRSRGYRANRMRDGYPDWKARGYAVDTVTSYSGKIGAK
jgi:rhodanese-related sulfurtransferase